MVEENVKCGKEDIMPADDARLTEREHMAMLVASSVKPRDPRVVEAFRRIPRHRFVPESEQGQAYEDRPLPIGEMQTISQPSMIAVMLHVLDCTPTSRVLEVGAGSGYAAALLSCLAAEVDAVEIRPELAARARRTLEDIGIQNVRIHAANGSQGWPEGAPYDRILVSAAPGEVPAALGEQLTPGGRIAIPVGDSVSQRLLVGAKDATGNITWEEDVRCLFVPLVTS
jgi:protein-L-isoaspartate(D-aspartate) O-methyltransferase